MLLPVAMPAPPPSPMRAEIIQRWTVAHHLYVDPDGIPVPLPVSGYLTAPRKPLEIMHRVLTHNGVHPGQMTRMRLSDVRPAHLPDECLEIDYISIVDPALPFNLPGSLLSVLHGRAFWPLHGTVAIIRQADPETGVRRKLTVYQKQQVEGTMTIINAVLSGRPTEGVVPPQAVDMVTSCMRALVAMEAEYVAGELAFNPAPVPHETT